MLSLLGFPAMMGGLGAGLGAGVQAGRRLLHQHPTEKRAGVVSSLLGGALKGTGKLVAKYPVTSILGVYPAARAAAGAYGKRVAGTEAEHVLAARPGQPSAYSDVNFHELFPHKLQPWQKFRLSRNYPAWRARIGVKS